MHACVPIGQYNVMCRKSTPMTVTRNISLTPDVTKTDHTVKANMHTCAWYNTHV